MKGGEEEGSGREDVSVVTSAASASSGDDLDDWMARESARGRGADSARGTASGTGRGQRGGSGRRRRGKHGRAGRGRARSRLSVPRLSLAENKVRVLPVAWPKLPRTARQAARAVRRAPRPPRLRRVVEKRVVEGIGRTSQAAKAQAARRALARMREWVPGLRVSPGCIPHGWFAWAEDNLWRGVPPWEVLATLSRKGFRPALCGALMEVVEAVAALRVAGGMPDGPQALRGLGRVHAGAMLALKDAENTTRGGDTGSGSDTALTGTG